MIKEKQKIVKNTNNQSNMSKYDFNPYPIALLIGIGLVPINLILRAAINSYFSVNISYYEVLIPILILVPLLVYFGSSKSNN